MTELKYVLHIVAHDANIHLSTTKQRKMKMKNTLVICYYSLIGILGLGAILAPLIGIATMLSGLPIITDPH